MTTAGPPTLIERLQRTLRINLQPRLQDPQGARQALDDCEDCVASHQRDRWTRILVVRWAKSDVGAALGWVLARPQSPERKTLVATVAADILTSGTSLAALGIAFELDARAQHGISGAAYLLMDVHDPVAILQALENPGENRLDHLIRRGLVAAWASVDPRSALDWARSQHESSDYAELVMTPLLILAQSAPEEAIVVADTLDGRVRRLTLASVLNTWAGSDPSAAADWISYTSYDEPDAITVVACHYAMLSGRDAFNWAYSLPPDLRRSAVPSVMFSITQDSPTAARDLMSRIGDTAIREIAAKQLVDRWVEIDPYETLHWIAAEGQAQSRDTLYATALLRWAQVDAESALTAVDYLPERARNNAILVIIDSARARHESTLVDEAFGRIADRQGRIEAARLIYSYLRSDDTSERADRYRYLARQ